MKQTFCKHCRRRIKKIPKSARGNGWMHAVGGWKTRQVKCPKGPEPGGRPPELKGQRSLFPPKPRRKTNEIAAND